MADNKAAAIRHTALVTGASSGIGESFAILSADEVAEKSYAAMIAGKDCIVTGAATQAARLAIRILPSRLSMRWLRESYSQVRA